VSAAEALELAASGWRILDVREQVEWNEGHIPTATLLPLADLPARIAEVAPDREAPLLVHCAVGARSLRASAWLVQNGYTSVASMRASLLDWRRLGGAWEAPEQLLTPAQQRRYSRQVLIPEIGQAGQRKLLDSKVLLIGAGGLGSPVALYLAASGIGTIGLVDDDVVDESNLQRQVLHTSDRVGMAKTESARITLNGLNPETRVVEHRERLEAENVERLIADYDVIVDGTDNFDTRYLLNDAAVKLRKPVVHGSIYRWDGQVTTFVPFEGPCYRCMYPTQPPPELAPACDIAGVLGVLPGIAGLLQANEVFKLVLGVGETLAGRLLMFDAMSTEFSEVKIWRDPACPACGEGSLA
jgi:sulfur-carrier protein adenylyltransferase/sulfurtransferase